MAQIEIESIGDGRYRVTVDESGSRSSHEVTVQSDDLQRLADDRSAVDLIEASFRFLLDREPKESIMKRFDLSVISRYFPEYPDRIGDYL